MSTSSKNISFLKALTFDDVLLVPQFSDVLPSDVKTNTKCGNLNLSIPILSAAMDTVTEMQMALQLGQLGGLGIIHKNMSPQAQAEMIINAKKHGAPYVGAALGVTATELQERLPALINAGVDALVIDTAHGHSAAVINAVRYARKQSNKDLTIIAGNIVTADAALALAQAGADGVKVGIGPGSICTTRIVAGVGMPQLTAVLQVASALKHAGLATSVIADGGIKHSGDICKALAAGAHAVMLGNLLAGTTEAPGERTLINGKEYKTHRGMGSLGAMKQGSKDRYFQDQETNQKLVPEGVEGQIPCTGDLKTIVHQLLGGLRAGMGYLGAKDLQEFNNKAEFVEITSLGLRESHVHSLTSYEGTINYKNP